MTITAIDCSSCYKIGFIMTTLLIISAYVLNVFLNRWLNKIAYQKAGADVAPKTWFIPIIPILVLIYIIFLDGFFEKNNWFNGSRW